MLQRLVEAHLAGQSSRQIAAWIHPPVSHATISNFVSRHIVPVLGNADAIKALLGFSPTENKELPKPLQHFTAPLQIDNLARHALTAIPVLTIRDGRIKAQVDRHRRLTQVVDERAADMALCETCRRPEADHPVQAVRPDGTAWECAEFNRVPGGATGLIVRKLKKEGTEYELDTGLLSEFREHEKQIAIELGQWQVNNAAGSVSVQIICPQAPSDAMPRVSFASEDTIEAGEDIGVIQLG